MSELAVALVDDNEADNYYHRRSLTRASDGLEIVEFRTAESFVEALKARHFDLVFLDLNLPVLNGWELLELVSEHAPNARVVVLSISHNPLDKARAEAAAQVLEYREKPLREVDAKDLLARLAALG